MKPQTKYVILFSIYIFVVLYLLLQYLSGSNLANIEKLSSNSQKKVKKLVNEVSNELAKEYQLFKRIKSLKQKIKNLKEQHQLEILKIKGQTVSSSTNPTEMNKEPSTETKPNKETINEDSVTETKPIVIPKNDDEKYVDIDQDVHTLAEQDGVIPIIVFTYERAEYLKRCLNSLFKYIPTEGFVIYVSQDGNHQGVTNLVKTYTNRVIHLQHPRDFVVPPEKRQFAVYHAISQHYKWAIEKVFSNPKYSRVILLEEDIEISPDFFSYFTRTSELLDKDKTLYCVSAWNDNGQTPHVQDPKQLYRTDFFPGLGWMMTREFWNEIRPKWPLGFWDDWLRQPSQRKGRSCIYPEISRTYTFGERGASQGQFWGFYLQNIKLNDQDIDWKKVDISYLEKNNYDQYIQNLLSGAIKINNINELQNYHSSDLKLIYQSIQDLNNYSKHFNLMGDMKKGIPRAAYDGIVIFRFNGNRIILEPSVPRLTYESK